MRKTIAFILITALIFLSVSCGIPSIYVPSDNDIVINAASTESGEFTVALSSTVRAELADDFPYIYFFYTVSTESQSSYFSSAMSSFNSKFSVETGGTMISDNLKDQPIAYYRTGSGDSEKTYGIYQLYDFISYQLPNEESQTFRFVYNNEDGKLTFTDNDGAILKDEILRYNEKVFTATDFETYQNEIVDFENTTYTVSIYAVVCCQFNAYNNIYNTKLNVNKPVFEFKITT